MLHSLRPEHFVASQYLRTPWQCPECGRHFLYGDGVMSLAYYRETETGEIRQGLVCFCSTICLLRAPHDAGAHEMSTSSRKSAAL
jgi:hypothetical protein